MTTPTADDRSAQRRALDESIAAELPLALLDLPAGAMTTPVETLLPRPTRRPAAVAGIVQNGVVCPIDPAVKLAENSRVIIVAAE